MNGWQFCAHLQRNFYSARPPVLVGYQLTITTAFFGGVTAATPQGHFFAPLRALRLRGSRSTKATALGRSFIGGFV
jgi:hypothetical protein